MIFQIILVIGLILIWIMSIMLTIFIMFHLKFKPLGMQTLLDLIRFDTACWWLIEITILSILCLLSIIIDRPSYILAIIVNIVIYIAIQILFSSTLITSIVRMLTVLRPGWLSDVPDSKVLKISRHFTFFITLVAVIMDFKSFKGKSVSMTLLTKDDQFER